MSKEDQAIKDEIEAATGFSTAQSDDWAKENLDIYNEYSAARALRYKDMVENDNFYHNVQYDATEKSEIIAKGQAPLPINVTYSIIKQMISLMTGEDPVWTVDPVGDTDKSYAYTMRELLNATWYNSRGRRQLSQISKEMLVTGVGYGMVSPRLSGRDFTVNFSWVPYHQSLVSPSTREFDFSDTENWVLTKMLSFQQASELLGVSIKEIAESAIAGAGMETMDSKDDVSIPYVRYAAPIVATTAKLDNGKLPTRGYVRIIQRHTMERTNAYIVNVKGNNATLTRKIYFKKTDFLRNLERSGEVTIDQREIRVLAKYISYGAKCHKYYVPMDSYGITPFIDEFNGNPYCLGEVDFLYGLQRALNKFVLLSILNATLANTMRMMAVKGTIDKKQYEDNYAIPGSLTEFEWSEGQPPPQQINPQPLSGAFFEFPKLLMYIMEYMTGIFGVVQGDPTEAPRTASGLMSLQNYGGQKVKLISRQMAESLSAVGDNAIALYQNYAPYNQTISYFQEGEEQPKQVKYNQLVPKDGRITIQNDVSIGKFKTRVRAIQNYGSERVGKANLLANLAAQTRSPALIKPILKLADIPEADQIAQEVDVISQQQQTIQQMDENIKRLNQVNKQLQNEIIQRTQDVSVKDFEVQLNNLLVKIKMELGDQVAAEFGKLKEETVRAIEQTKAQAAIAQERASLQAQQAQDAQVTTE